MSKQTVPPSRATSAEQVRRYLREAYIELTKKVIWPSREQTVNLTVVVVVVCVVIALFLGGVDFVFASLVKALANK